MTMTTIGIDLPKNVFQIHGVYGSGKAVLKKQLRRNQVLTYFIKLTTCTIGLEACGGAHYCARKHRTMGHTVKLMAPQFVKPLHYKSHKLDRQFPLVMTLLQIMLLTPSDLLIHFTQF